MADEFEIEFDEPEHGACECCGAASAFLSRFVRRGGETVAFYCANVTGGHDGIIVLLMLGDLLEEARAGSRVSFAFRLWRAGNDVNTTLVGPDKASWDDDFDEALPVDTALRHPRLPEIFALSDLIVGRDPPIRAFLRADQPAPGTHLLSAPAPHSAHAWRWRSAMAGAWRRHGRLGRGKPRPGR